MRRRVCGETETEGIDVPVVFAHSPYRGELGDAQNHPVDFDVLPQEHLRPGHGGERTEARRGWGRRVCAPTCRAGSTTATSRAATR